MRNGLCIPICIPVYPCNPELFPKELENATSVAEIQAWRKNMTSPDPALAPGTTAAQLNPDDTPSYESVYGAHREPAATLTLFAN